MSGSRGSAGEMVATGLELHQCWRAWERGIAAQFAAVEEQQVEAKGRLLRLYWTRHLRIGPEHRPNCGWKRMGIGKQRKWWSP